MHELLPLPFSYDALEPYMSQETLQYHHGKHHFTYVQKLNELILSTEFANLPLEEIIKTSQGAIFNNAAQIWNHNLFWNSLVAPEKSRFDPDSILGKKIMDTFGSFEAFTQAFQKEALSRFGSGWTWLVQKGDTLEIYSSPNAENPLTLGGNTLFGLDVWEHSYYIDYRNDRAKYVENFWKILNWEKIETRVII